MMGSLLSTGRAAPSSTEYEPIPLSPAYPCTAGAVTAVLQGDRKYKAQAPLSSDFAAQMLTQELERARRTASTRFIRAALCRWSILG